ncbi:MAG: carbohydrate binding family 9 domain-containing protein, partial [Phycisphaerales bacterium]|nr:carbohydrate binding family 9 domain-containing protein [Phycisphaerales bacterium]
MKHVTCWLLCCLSSAWAGDDGDAAASDDAMAYRAPAMAVSDPPVIDGVLDDAAWALVEPVSNFTQRSPVEGAAPSQRTAFRVLYDRDAIYIGVRCWDDDPGGIIATQMQRDGGLGVDDNISIVLDTFLDQRNGYLFEVGAAGAKRDALVEDNDRTRYEWDGIWYARTTIDDLGWVAEISIPTRTVAFNPELGQWGFNIERQIRRLNESVRWASPRLARGITSMTDTGRITGLSDLNVGRGIEVKPYTTLTYREATGDVDFEVGGDVSFRLTPNLTLTLTYNTDFAETEVDARRVNLTRFPLFFPEKRDFFLQDAGIFNFGGIRSSPLPFFSRRIGIVDGREVDLEYGAKLTGRVDDLNVGLLTVRTGEAREVDSKFLTVGRVQANVGEESTLGAIATYGNPQANEENGLVGVDFNFRDSRRHADTGGVVYGNVWAQATESSDRGSDATAIGGRAGYTSDAAEWNFFLARIGEDYNPALGFVSRAGRHELNTNFRYRYRPEQSGEGDPLALRYMDVRAGGSMFTDLSNELDTGRLTFPSVAWVNNAGDTLAVRHEISKEVPRRDFEISDGVVIPPGSYTFHRFGIGGSTSTIRPVSFSADLEGGGFYSGELVRTQVGVEWRPSASVLLGTSFEHNDVDLDEGEFETEVGSVRLNISFTPRLTWNNLIQYDNVSDSVGLNSRLHWIVRPGQDVFVVLNHGFDTSEGLGRWTAQD